MMPKRLGTTVFRETQVALGVLEERILDVRFSGIDSWLLSFAAVWLWTWT